MAPPHRPQSGERACGHRCGCANHDPRATRRLHYQHQQHRGIAPDYTVTPGVRGNHTGPVDPTSWAKPTPKQDDATARRIPLGRAGVDTECGNIAVFLSSPMSSYVTGTVIPVDGGTWASSGWVRDRAGKWALMGDVE